MTVVLGLQAADLDFGPDLIVQFIECMALNKSCDFSGSQFFLRKMRVMILHRVVRIKWVIVLVCESNLQRENNNTYSRNKLQQGPQTRDRSLPQQHGRELNSSVIFSLLSFLGPIQHL